MRIIMRVNVMCGNEDVMHIKGEGDRKTTGMRGDTLGDSAGIGSRGAEDGNAVTPWCNACKHNT